MHALRPVNPITTGKSGEVNYRLKICQIFTCPDEAATESGDFTILIKDAPTAPPCAGFRLNRQNLLERSVLDEEITVPSPTNIPTEAMENPRGEIYKTVANFASHTNATTHEINVLDAH
ncbi:MAG TPA: hypothetical protein VNH19_00455 [Candidatus Limnocylindrales bacterium]|nr:hypothetical protein [Candidatus Limnocylindrales bacterium]